MSTQIGTLQPNARAAQPMWPVAILALLVVAIVAVIVVTPDDTRPRDETTSAVVGASVSTGVPATHGKQLGSKVAVAPGFTGIMVNTPTELNGGIAFSSAAAVTGVPSELSGRFLAERAKQLGTEIGTEAGGGGTGSGSGSGSGSELCEICWKYR
ncbi:MAG: hypothetical protein ACRDHC_06895 [Actinomycetota bacterium]